MRFASFFHIEVGKIFEVSKEKFYFFFFSRGLFFDNAVNNEMHLILACRGNKGYVACSSPESIVEKFLRGFKSEKLRRFCLRHRHGIFVCGYENKPFRDFCNLLIFVDKQALYMVGCKDFLEFIDKAVSVHYINHRYGRHRDYIHQQADDKQRNEQPDDSAQTACQKNCRRPFRHFGVNFLGIFVNPYKQRQPEKESN